MGLNKYLINIILIFLFYSISYCAEYDMAADFKRQIDIYTNDIAKFENALNKNTLQLNFLNQQLAALSEELSKLADLLKAVDSKSKTRGDYLILNEASIDSQKSRLENLRNSYKNKIVWLYKYGNEIPLALLFTSSSLNQFYIRLQYLQKISLMRAKDAEKIKNLSYLLQEKRKLDGLSSKEKLLYIDTKKEQQKEVYQKKLLADIEIDSIKQLNDILTRQVAVKKQKINDLNIKLSQTTSLLKYSVHSTPAYGTIQKFEDLKGLMILPVNSVYLYLDFGNSVSPVTHTATFNNGLDFEISRNSDVRCVADGVVEKIYSLPTFGSIVVVKHSDKYKSVYAILNSIRIANNQQVKAGEVIASSGECIEGQLFHFEILENNIPIDPKLWFRW